MIRLWLNLARSGGTLLSRCLGAMEGVVLLSEVHPLGVRVIDPARQAAQWHGLLTPAEVARFTGGRARFDVLLLLLNERAADRGKRLLVRDWSHLDFLGAPFNEPAFQSRSSALLGARASLRRFATVRHPADQWASQQRLDLLRGRVDPAAYLRGCAAFARLASEIGFVRYEDFTQDPDAGLRAICTALDLEFDPGWRDRYRSYDKVTGDAIASGKSIEEIRPATRRPLDPSVRPIFEASEDYAEACRLLGYDPAPEADRPDASENNGR